VESICISVNRARLFLGVSTTVSFAMRNLVITHQSQNQVDMITEPRLVKIFFKQLRRRRRSIAQTASLDTSVQAAFPYGGQRAVKSGSCALW
jgi:hypothetical protein